VADDVSRANVAASACGQALAAYLRLFGWCDARQGRLQATERGAIWAHRLQHLFSLSYIDKVWAFGGRAGQMAALRAAIFRTAFRPEKNRDGANGLQQCGSRKSATRVEYAGLGAGLQGQAIRPP
jgi:hypothetical protein